MLVFCEIDKSTQGNDRGSCGLATIPHMQMIPRKAMHYMGMAARLMAAGLIAVSAGNAHCQPATPGAGNDYPVKPVRIVTSEAGGGNDFTARLVARGIASGLGQQVIVENRPSGVIPGETVAKAQPDGYTLLIYGGTFWIGPLLQPKVPYDVLRDFAPITLISSSPNVLLVHPSLPVRNVKDLILLAKSRPGQLNYASPSVGSAQHLAAVLFKSMSATDIVRVSYRGNGAAMTAVISGEVQLFFSPVASVGSHVKSGRAKALAVTALKPFSQMPGVPSIAASGLPGFESTSMSGMFAPSGTSVAVINRLNQETVKFLHSAEAREKLLAVGVEPAATPAEVFAAAIKSEMARMGKVIRDAGIRIE